jgi:transcriptional regulator with XRE-family HTH domain
MLDSVLVGKIIQKIRESKDLSQEVVSGLANLARSHLSMIETGDRKPTLETLFKIAEALSVKPSEIVAAIEEEIKKEKV